MDSRKYVDLAGSSEFVCTDQNVARDYAQLTKKLLGIDTRVWLLRVGVPATAREPWDGFDIGLPSGGNSLIESEVIQAGHLDLLNSKGLFADERAVSLYLSGRSGFEVEDSSSLVIVGIVAWAV